MEKANKLENWKRELEIAHFRERIRITRRMMTLGYFPRAIYFDLGKIVIEARERRWGDKDTLAEMVRLLACLDKRAKGEKNGQ